MKIRSALILAASLALSAHADPVRLVNVSTRMQVLTGNDVMIAGFVVGGSTNKTVAIVAAGPSLTQFGVANALADPTLTLVRSSDQSVIATNDDWGTAPNKSAIQASGFAPTHPSESVILMSLPPGAYTAIVTGAAGGTGVALTGVYEVGQTDVPLVNISTRGRVMSGNDVMIGGFVISGTTPKTVAIVGTGPSLGQLGIANPLANPTLMLVRSSDQAVLATNDNWQTDANAAILSATGFAPSNALEAAMLVTLDPGAYTAILAGNGGSTGIGILGVYEATIPADTQPPVVSTTYPLDTATNIAVQVGVIVLFSEPMDAATLNSNTFTLVGPTGPVPATISVNGNSVTLTPSANLMTSSPYTATVTTGARDLAGNALPQNYVFRFNTTAVEPPPIVAGCPTPASSAELRRLEWGAVTTLKRKSGEVTSYRVAQSQLGRASVAITQGQGTSTPASPITDITVSRCPGVIESTLHPACHFTTTNVNFAGIVAFNRTLPLFGLNTQEDLATLGCLAPNAEQYYVNIRWTFPSCTFSQGCGFSLQWGEGAF